MSQKLFVGKLPSKTTETQIQDLFSTIGEVEQIQLGAGVSFQVNAQYAYVTMRHESDAKKAMQTLNDTMFLDSRIKVTDTHSIDERGHTYFRYRRKK